MKKGPWRKMDLQVANGMLRLDGLWLRCEIGNGDIAPFGFGLLSCIGEKLMEPTETVERRVDQGVQDLIEASGLFDFETQRREKPCSLAVAFCASVTRQTSVWRLPYSGFTGDQKPLF